jgi:hypothetical protein
MVPPPPSLPPLPFNPNTLDNCCCDLQSRNIPLHYATRPPRFGLHIIRYPTGFR